MTIEQLRQHYTQHQRLTDHDPSGERIILENVTRFIWHPPKAGTVLYSSLTKDNADEAIEAEIEFFKSLDYAFEWKLFSYDTPDDMRERLLKYGFDEDEKEAVMVLPIADAPEKLLQAVTIDIRKATTREMFLDVDKVYYEVWKDDPFADASPHKMSEWFLPRYEKSPESISMYVVYVDGQPVSYGRVEFADDNPYASIWGGSTLEAYRRRGIYTQLVATRLQEAKARGCQYLTVDARQNTSMPILEKLGFIRIAYATAFNWESGVSDGGNEHQELNNK